nr:MAG TPA: hypothetical protein [Caudoviricetes sp.]
MHKKYFKKYLTKLLTSNACLHIVYSRDAQ